MSDACQISALDARTIAAKPPYIGQRSCSAALGAEAPVAQREHDPAQSGMRVNEMLKKKRTGASRNDSASTCSGLAVGGKIWSAAARLPPIHSKIAAGIERRPGEQHQQRNEDDERGSAADDCTS